MPHLIFFRWSYTTPVPFPRFKFWQLSKTVLQTVLTIVKNCLSNGRGGDHVMRTMAPRLEVAAVG
jgi:hypothetical protein